tara:strand:+ start:3386 stop:4567 length:1182 start_codon:yes stop_codon:yes gene_type:complete
MSQRIVIISNYYPPEMGAAANRIKNLAEGLQQKGNEITVICPLPNYPKGKIFKKYSNKFCVEEFVNTIKIKRYWIFPSKSKNAFVRLISMLSFAWSLWFSVFSFLRRKPDIFIINSPPLLVALSGLLLSKLLKRKTILNVSDIWPLSALDLGVIKRGFFYSFFKKVEKTNYKLADKIIGQSEETIIHINNIVEKSFLVYRNTPKLKEYTPKEKSKNTIKIVYAGLLGYAQGILSICKELNFKDLDAELHIYGSGMEEEDIIEITKNQDKNIYFHGTKTATEIKEEIRKYDVGFVPLRNEIYGAFPSKIFELAQLGIPILYIGGGEAAKVIIEKSIGFVSKPDDFQTLKENILAFKNMANSDFNILVNNSIKMHKEEFHLSFQLNKFNQFIISK